MQEENGAPPPQPSSPWPSETVREEGRESQVPIPGSRARERGRGLELSKAAKRRHVTDEGLLARDQRARGSRAQGESQYCP